MRYDCTANRTGEACTTRLSLQSHHMPLRTYWPSCGPSTEWSNWQWKGDVS